MTSIRSAAGGTSTQLEGARVSLRELRADDIDGLASILSDDRVTGWLSFDNRSRPEAIGLLEGVVDRISAAISPSNHASLAVAKKLGMTYEGRLRDHDFAHGDRHDSRPFSVLAHER